MPYSFQIVWHERARFLPAVLAVAFSAVLVALQGGLLLGLLALSSRPIDRTPADLWVGSEEVPSIGFGAPLATACRLRVIAQPEVDVAEPYLFGFGEWHTPQGGTVQCYVVGSRLEPGALGALRDLTPEMRAGLTEPGTVVIDASDRANLGLMRGLGEVAEVSQRRVRVIGLVRGPRSIGMMPGVFCSLRTASLLLPALQGCPGPTTYVLARCKDARQAPAVARRLREQYPQMTTLTSAEFSLRTRTYWLTKTKAGTALGLSALLGLFVGAAVTSQALRAATVAARSEYAVLSALGIPRRRMAGLIVAQSFWVGVAGVVLAVPAAAALGELARALGLEVQLAGWVLAGTAALTLVVAMLSGLLALRSLRMAEPLALLR